MTNPPIAFKDVRLGIVWHEGKQDTVYDLLDKTVSVKAPDGNPIVLELEQVITLTIIERLKISYVTIQEFIKNNFLKIAKANEMKETEMRIQLFAKSEVDDLEGYIYKNGEPLKPLKLEDLIKV